METAIDVARHWARRFFFSLPSIPRIVTAAALAAPLTLAAQPLQAGDHDAPAARVRFVATPKPVGALQWRTPQTIKLTAAEADEGGVHRVARAVQLEAADNASSALADPFGDRAARGGAPELLPPDSAQAAPGPDEGSSQIAAADTPPSPPATLKPAFVRQEELPPARQSRIYNGRDCAVEQGRCREVRDRLRPITAISLDITPDFRRAGTEAEKRAELDQLEMRTWRDQFGEILMASGRLTDFQNGQVWITDAEGRISKFAFRELHEDDLCYVAAWWFLPNECKLEADRFLARSWTPSTFAWKASATCHKPLYFEEVQLERYGHTMGPLLQPAVSSAHFFLNIAVLPYKMGIHPMYECQYPLGYYRPGSCAPWLVSPMPISLRGALSQAGVVTGGIFLLP